MGLIAASIRLLSLNNYRLELEAKILKINQEKMQLAASINDLVDAAAGMKPKSPELKELERRKEKLKYLEHKLDEKMHRYEFQLKMVEQEYQSCQQMFDKNLQYSYGGR